MDDFKRIIFKNNSTFFVLLIMATSCNIINPAEPIPAYLKIDTFNLFTINNVNINQGSNSNKIENVWLYVDEYLQGVYSLPASIPVLESGTHIIKLRPGINLRSALTSSANLVYPFYETFDSLVNFNSGSEISVFPTSTYISGLVFTNENFESNGGIIFDSTSNSLAIMTTTKNSAEVFEGTGSGKVFLDSAHYKMEIATGYNILPVVGNEKIIIELNYKTSIPFKIGIYAKTSNVVGATDDQFFIGQVKNEEWTKLYLDITGPVHFYPLAKDNGFRIYFSAELTNANDSAFIYIDNFKLIHP